ncbi:nucleoside monophosphate kinase [Embleya sp. AB8]|uniref:nucleoside monophosphate kinase n=1 Tax=Embleya sp. AB8 TaxID=3156304 RepID=UPI003C76F420
MGTSNGDGAAGGWAAVILLGPPASGKSTLSRELATRYGARVFRLREYAARHAECDPAVTTEVRDALGWLPDGVAVRLVRRAVVDGPFRPSAKSPVVFEGYPGNAVQADLLARLFRARGVPSVAVVLQLPPDVARHRAHRRRVCPTCVPEPGGESHRPTLVTPAGACTRCGQPAQLRAGDAPDRFAARTRRFHHELPRIRLALTRGAVSWRPIDADRPADAVLAAVDTELATHHARKHP